MAVKKLDKIRKEEVELDEKSYVSSLSPDFGRKGSHDVIGKDGKVVKSYPYTKQGMNLAQKHLEKMKEEVELDEISKKTIGSYVKKASSDMASNAYNLGARDPLKKPGSWDKAFKRKAGIEKATDRLTKEEVALDEAKKDHFVYQKGVPKTKEVVHRGTEQSSKDWIEKNAKHFSHKGKDFDIYKGKYPNVKPSDRLDYRYVAEESDINEVSDKKLDAYRQKAFADQPAGDDGSDKYRKRKFGRDLAFAKQTGRAKVLTTKESVELDEAKTDIYHKHMLKALGKSRLPKGHQYTSAIANNGDFVVKDGGGRTVGRIAKGDHNLKDQESA